VEQQPKRREPILAIDVLKVDYGSTTIKLIRPGHPEKTIETFWGHDKLADYYERYHQALKKFRYELSDSLDQKPVALARALQALFQYGKVGFADIFEDSFPEITDYLMKHALVGGSNYARRTPPHVIEVRTETTTDIIPIECLVMVDSKYEIEDLRDVLSAASGILGFSFIIKRVITRTRQSQKRYLDNVPRLPVKYFCDKSLKGAEDECAFFKEHEEFLCLEGPWPHEYTASTASDFVRHLCRPDTRFGCTDGADTGYSQRDEIHHISCHCFTNEKDSWKSGLQLVGERITLEVMKERWTKFYREARNRPMEMPLVFLNACGSSEVTPKGMASFLEFFLVKNGNCGFIGCESRIPDIFASQFSKQFYLHLLRGFGVGEAVFWARRKLLERHKNPLGILYTAYVDPYLRVAKAANID